MGGGAGHLLQVHCCINTRLTYVSCSAQDEHGNLHAKSWAEALDTVKQRLAGLQGDQVRGIAGKLADAESMIALKVGL